jgi:acyl carrier protein
MNERGIRMSRDMFVESIRRYFETDLLKRSKIDHIGINDNVIASGLVDSLGIIKIIAFLEETFSIKIDDSDLVFENFETIESIATFAQNCKNR